MAEIDPVPIEEVIASALKDSLPMANQTASEVADHIVYVLANAGYRIVMADT